MHLAPGQWREGRPGKDGTHTICQHANEAGVDNFPRLSNTWRGGDRNSHDQRGSIELRLKLSAGREGEG